MAEKTKDILFEALKGLLRPIVRFCLNRSLKLQDLHEAAKIAFLEVAEEEMNKADTPISMSRLSVMTGVHRRDVMRFSNEERVPKEDTTLLTRVVGQWQRDSRFSGPNGKPRLLSFEGKDSEFVKLIQSVSKDLNPYTILFELERVNAVEKTGDKLKLRTRVYLPTGDLKKSLSLLVEDSNDLIVAVDENIFVEGLPSKNLHIKTQYDNIPPSELPAIREWLLERGATWHEEVRLYLSQFDRDLNPDRPTDPNGRVRVAVGTFSRIEDLDPVSPDSKKITIR